MSSLYVQIETTNSCRYYNRHMWSQIICPLFILLYRHHRSPWTSHPPHTLHTEHTSYFTYDLHIQHIPPYTHITPPSHTYPTTLLTYHPTHISHHTPYTQTGSWERSWWKFQSHVNLRCWHCKISGVCGQISETPATSRVPGRDPLPKHNWQDQTCPQNEEAHHWIINIG